MTQLETQLETQLDTQLDTQLKTIERQERKVILQQRIKWQFFH